VLFAALMSAAIFGNVSSIMLRLYRGTEEYHEMLTSIKEFTKFHYIPKPLANRLVESYQHSRSFTHGVDMNSVRIFIACLSLDCMNIVVTLDMHIPAANGHNRHINV
jgi:potassium voltage-gated channel Eag-related subfamily H member 2